MRLSNLIQKFQRVCREDGFSIALCKAICFARNTEGRKKRRIDRKTAKKERAEVLFINGCRVESPVRYRVLHQMEQLQEAGATCRKVYFEDLELAMEKNFQSFVFYRCEYTDRVGAFIELAKQHGKKVIFDIDDLVFDTIYTNQVPFVQDMSLETKVVFDGAVERMQKTLRLCESATTTTEALAEELKKYVSEVFINRNVASKEMVVCAEKAYREVDRNHDKEVWIGYFSGSQTHNKDFGLIHSVLIRMLKEYPQLRLMVVGEVEMAKEMQEFTSQICQKKSVDWRELPKLIAQVDINLAPLEDTLFNRSKSEIKWIEAALVHVPTVASRVGAFEQMIEDGKREGSESGITQVAINMLKEKCDKRGVK